MKKNQASLERSALAAHLDGLLDSARYRDYCPNGLQVEGRATIRRIVLGVTANLGLIEAAIAQEADALIVHHGWFWKGEDGRITGFRRQRLSRLLAYDLNLFAWHLPLDAHGELGNNAQLALRLGWQVEGRFGEQEIGFHGRAPRAATVGELAAQLEGSLGRPPLVIGDAARPLGRIAWCSGGAQSWFEQAVELGVDAFISGEIAEHCVHLAREAGVAYLACGHHATERYGVMALGEHLSRQFGLDCRYVEIDSPV